MPGKLYIVSAPSGSGKTTLLGHLVKNFDHLIFSVSYTTRAPRGHETDGVEYRFIDREQFQEMVKREDFLEWAEYHGNLYGTSRRFVEENTASGKDVILDIDVHGAEQVKSKIETAVTIFLMPPSFSELHRRLKERQLEDDDAIRKRLAIAKKEILRYHDYDYIVINDRLEESIGRLDAIVRSGATPPVPQEDRIQEIIASFGGMD